MGIPSSEQSSSSTAPKGKRRPRHGKSNGPKTQPSTQNVEAPVEKKEPTAEENREKLLFEANALLADSIARFRELGVQVITINETLSGVPVAWFRLQGCKFRAQRTEDTTILLSVEAPGVKAPATPVQK